METRARGVSPETPATLAVRVISDYNQPVPENNDKPEPRERLETKIAALARGFVDQLIVTTGREINARATASVSIAQAGVDAARQRLQGAEYYSLDQIKAAFWAMFHESGEYFFHYQGMSASADECEESTAGKWAAFLEELHKPR